jgi:pyruvate formate lyase activating enzyme
MADVALDPELLLTDPSVVRVGFSTPLADGRLRCDLCPRACKLHDGQRGLCFVRGRIGDTLVLTTYGRSSGFCVDPIEKKPLSHFLPGTPVLSFGTAGCNLACSFCQNWDISKSRSADTLARTGSPDGIAQAALDLGCRSVAFTYNDPVIFFEYARDVAAACRAQGLKTVAVTAGYVSEAARAEFFACFDAANVDLKAFTESFYRQQTGGHLQPVLDTLRYLARETNVWTEITTLLIPGLNDGDPELRELTAFVHDQLGPDVPLHFSAFHPDHKLLNCPRTPAATLYRARDIARSAGLRHIYLGNLWDPDGEATHCPGCGNVVIQRESYAVTGWALDSDGACRTCGTRIAGHFEARPGVWGSRRLPVRIED